MSQNRLEEPASNEALKNNCATKDYHQLLYVIAGKRRQKEKSKQNNLKCRKRHAYFYGNESGEIKKPMKSHILRIKNANNCPNRAQKKHVAQSPPGSPSPVPRKKGGVFQ
ncbi:hypothetical protein Tco_1321033 [Tanacetum coccineum]